MVAESSTPSKSPRAKRLYTVDEANAAMPLVRAITRDLVQTSGEILERQQRVAKLVAGRSLESGDPYEDELLHVQRQLDQDLVRVRSYVDELTRLGIAVKSATEGLIDFPSRLDGRLVYLCWKLGEAEVSHWHELHAGFAERRPLAMDLVGSSDTRADGESVFD